jgi:hypothetical protein
MDDHNDTHPSAVGLVNRATGAAIDLSDDIEECVSDGDVLEATDYNLTIRGSETPSPAPPEGGFDQRMSSIKQEGFTSLENARAKLNRGIAVVQQNLQQNLQQYTADYQKQASKPVGTGPAVITSVEQAEEELRRWEEKKARKLQEEHKISESPAQWRVIDPARADVRFLKFSAKSPVSDKDRSLKSATFQLDRCQCSTPKTGQGNNQHDRNGRSERAVSPSSTPTSVATWIASQPTPPPIHVDHPLAASRPVQQQPTSPVDVDQSSTWALLQSTIGNTKEKLQSTIGNTKEKLMKQMGVVEVQLQQKQEALNSATAKLAKNFERGTVANEQKENEIPAWARQQTPENLRSLEEENIHGSKSRLAAAAAMIQWPNMRRSTSPQLNDILDCFDES